MKHYLLALALLFTLSAQATGVTPRHRHHPSTEQVAAQPKSQPTTDNATNDEGIEAYSDTTSVDSTATDSTMTTVVDDYDVTTPANQVDDVIDQIADGTGWKGATLLIIALLCVIIFLLAPIIIVALILRYLLKRHNQKVDLAEKAIAAGQPIPNDALPEIPASTNYYLNRGIRNTAIGLGLCIMFAIWDSEFLQGIGALVACIGIGQVIIAKINKK
jgi:hypothetical protein